MQRPKNCNRNSVMAVTQLIFRGKHIEPAMQIYQQPTCGYVVVTARAKWI